MLTGAPAGDPMRTQAMGAFDPLKTTAMAAAPDGGPAIRVECIASREATARMVSNAQSVAGSGDLGYTYGTFVTGGLADPDSAWYVHVWQRSAASPWQARSLCSR